MLNTAVFIILLLALGVTSQLSSYSSPYVDPFYTVPSNISSYSPGAIIRSRSINSNMAFVTALQVFYRTSDSNNVAVATAATILKGAINSGNQLVAYQDPEDSVNRTCQPSWQFASGGHGQGDNQGRELGGLHAGFCLHICLVPVTGSYQDAMGHGWTLVVPDYEGLNSSLGAGHLNGKAVLDSMRAALASSAGLSSASRIGAFGTLVNSL